jgi:H+-translocating NAD(P) transhydrogenase subunit alpha
MEHFLIQLTVFVLAVFVGFEVISKVPSMLHTPLMSATNAVHGIVVVGAMLVAGAAIGGAVGHAIGLAAMILATINVVGGFAVTERMLEMFKGRTGTRP